MYTMPAATLVPKVTSASASMVLAVLDKQSVLLFQSQIQLLGLSQIQDTIQNVNISFIIF